MGGGGVEVGVTEMYFPSLGLGHKHKLRVILRQHYHILAAFSEKIYSHILGRVATICVGSCTTSSTIRD